MIKVSDMFYLTQPNVKSLFIEEVKDFFTENNIYSIPNVSFSGKSGLLSTYDFAIAPSSKHSERLIKAVNNLDVTKAGYITFLWGDTKENRPCANRNGLLNTIQCQARHDIMSMCIDYYITFPWHLHRCIFYTYFDGKEILIMPVTTQRFRMTLYDVLDDLGIERHTPHDCRHTFNALCDRFGVNERDKKVMLGHSFKDVTNKVYLHRTLEDLRAEIEKIDPCR